MTDEIPHELAYEVQKYTNFPWWNGKAYAEYHGYPQRIWTLEQHVSSAVDDLFDVIEWLRSEGQYQQSDRLRVIAGRLAQQIKRPPEGSIVKIAQGWAK